MDDISGRSPANINKYNFSKKNLEFLRPEVINLVDQLLADYQSQKDNK